MRGRTFWEASSCLSGGVPIRRYAFVGGSRLSEGSPLWEVHLSGRSLMGGRPLGEVIGITKRKLILISDIKQLIVAT